jgi:hypothetical protein
VVRVVAFVTDLMFRSRIGEALPGVEFARDPADAAGAGAVVVDLGHHAGLVGAIRAAAPSARVVAYGRHTEGPALDRALEDGADVALPRSAFFADVPTAVLG